MPKLMFAAVCQKAMIDPGDDSLTLVGVMTNLEVQTPSLADDESGSFIPLRWVAVSSWMADEDERDIKFEQLFELILPSGTVFGQTKSKIEFVARRCTMITRSEGFPAPEEGVYVFRFSIRRQGDNDWSDSFDCPVAVNYANYAFRPNSSEQQENAASPEHEVQ